ncbi:MAG TPA: oligopeptide transporter, OPT family [Gammaproteobacteria bacterium]|nr:oligopeptide transporter, OPT family [Gammaproteobacteria bacterium]
MREITFRSIIIGCILSVILAASNTFLALKIGILTSASIPAAVISMGLLRLFKNSTIHENNMIQTCASAGEAIAGGIVYAIPALIIIHYWTHFGYWHNFLIALVGGTLGVLFSVPLRKSFMENPHLRFPEAQAITRVLQMEHEKAGQIKNLLMGGALGGLLEFFQSGLQIIAASMQKIFTVGKTSFGFGAGFSATLLGAGYLIGFPVGISLLIGAITGYLIILPILTGHFQFALNDLLSEQLRFIGIGSMLTAGIWTLLALVKPIFAGILTSIQALTSEQKEKIPQKDIPYFYVILGILFSAIITYYLLNNILLFNTLSTSPLLIISCMIFIFLIGFIFAAICGYFSGLVGVTASPGSSIVIGGLMIAAFSLRAYLHVNGTPLTHDIILNAGAVVIVLIAIVEGIAAITNDNMQDLKVGHSIGSTPWKQQVMLLLGVLCASAVVPLVMQLLFSVYGLGGVFPHAGMDPSKMLPAPVASVLATMTQAIFDRDLPYEMLFVGAGISVFFIIISFFMPKKLSVLGIAMGLYLPLASSTALFIGSFIALFYKSERSVLTACGLVAGAALMDVLLAIPFAISGNPNVLDIMPKALHNVSIILGILCVLGIAKLLRAQRDDA